MSVFSTFRIVRLGGQSDPFELVVLVFQSHYYKYLHAGRLIQWLVTLNDQVEDLVNEADRRACNELVDRNDWGLENSQELSLLEIMLSLYDVLLVFCREDRLHCCYYELLWWIPTLKSEIAAETEDSEVKLILRHVITTLRFYAIHYLMLHQAE